MANVKFKTSEELRGNMQDAPAARHCAHASTQSVAGEAAKAAVGGVVIRLRSCLKCQTKFQSEWAGERICRNCKGSSTWRNGALSAVNDSRK